MRVRAINLPWEILTGNKRPVASVDESPAHSPLVAFVVSAIFSSYLLRELFFAGLFLVWRFFVAALETDLADFAEGFEEDFAARFTADFAEDFAARFVAVFAADFKDERWLLLAAAFLLTLPFLEDARRAGLESFAGALAVGSSSVSLILTRANGGGGAAARLPGWLDGAAAGLMACAIVCPAVSSALKAVSGRLNA